MSVDEMLPDVDDRNSRMFAVRFVERALARFKADWTFALASDSGNGGEQHLVAKRSRYFNKLSSLMPPRAKQVAR
jgi:hypothetical protein